MIINQLEPNIKYGLLIDWDLCKVIKPPSKFSTTCQYTCTVSTMFELPYLLRPDISFQQGTWQFMAADLVENPAIPHTPKHDLESIFWVLLWMMLLYMKTSWSIEICSSTLNSMMSPDIYQSSGGRGKLDFMQNPCALNDLYMPDNPKMEELLMGVFQTVCK